MNGKNRFNDVPIVDLLLSSNKVDQMFQEITNIRSTVAESSQFACSKTKRLLECGEECEM